jgi:hypothetical protein
MVGDAILVDGHYVEPAVLAASAPSESVRPWSITNDAFEG